MSFENLLDQCTSSALLDVALHWNEARASRRIPAWSDIKPSAIARHLPVVWAWKYDRATEKLIGRLAGDMIIHAHGENLRGRQDEEFFAKRGGTAIVERHRRVISEPCFYYGRGSVFQHTGRLVTGERLILPLAEDGEIGDGIFGVTVFTSLEPFTEGEGYAASEIGEFLPL